MLVRRRLLESRVVGELSLWVQLYVQESGLLGGIGGLRRGCRLFGRGEYGLDVVMETLKGSVEALSGSVISLSLIEALASA